MHDVCVLFIGLDDKDSKEIRKNTDPHLGESNKEDTGGEVVSAEDKTKLKPQILSVGIIGSARHHTNSTKGSSTQIPPRMQRKSESERRDSSRNKGARGSSGGRGGTHGSGRELSGRAPPRSGVGPVPITKQNSSDVGDECWETTSENSELDDRERKHDVHNGRKAFSRQREPPGSSRRTSGLGLNSCVPRTGRGGSGGMGSTANSGGTSSRAPGAEKRAGYNGGTGGQRGTSSSVMGVALQANGRAPGPRPNSSQSPAVAGNKVAMKETTTAAVNRVDEIKLNDPALVSQALSELNSSKKNARVEKEKSNALEGIDLNNYASKWFVCQSVAATLMWPFLCFFFFLLHCFMQVVIFFVQFVPSYSTTY
jgi:hypothetical protein